MHLPGVLQATNTLWGLIFDFFLVGIILTKSMISYGCFSLLGIILVIHPNLITGIFGYYVGEENLAQVEEGRPIDINFIIGVLCGLGMGFFQVMVFYIIGSIAKHINPSTSVFYWGFFAALYGGFGTLYTEFIPWS